MTTPYSSYGASGSGQTPYAASVSQVTPAHSTPATFTSVLSSVNFDQSQPATPTPAGRGRPRGASTGAKRGRKPKGTAATGASSPRPFITSSFSTPAPSSSATPAAFTNQAPNAQYPRVHWAMPSGAGTTDPGASSQAASVEGGSGGDAPGSGDGGASSPSSAMVIDPALVGVGGVASVPGTPRLDGLGGVTLPGRLSQPPPPGSARPLPLAAEEDVEGDDELLPAMADDDYSAQLSWQSQSKDNLKWVKAFSLTLNL